MDSDLVTLEDSGSRAGQHDARAAVGEHNSCTGPMSWDSSPISRGSALGKHARQAWEHERRDNNSPDHHEQHGRTNRNFTTALRTYEPLPSKAHTERGSGRGSPTLSLPSWQSSNRAQLPLMYRNKRERKGVEAYL